MSNRYARVCMEEAIKYGRTRKTFGKRLVGLTDRGEGQTRQLMRV